MRSERPRSILIWDEDSEPPLHNGQVLLWRGFRSAGVEDVFSLPELVDAQAEELRRRFLALVHGAGTTRVGGRTVIDHLRLENGISYWWMTSIAQKDVYARSPYIFDALKLFAFDDFARSSAGQPIELRSADRRIAEVIAAWCRSEGRPFQWVRARRSTRPGSPRSSAYALLPPSVRAFLSFCKYSAARSPGWNTEPSAALVEGVSVFDIFTHLDPTAISSRVFRSGYWSKLVELLAATGKPVNWLHWYYPHPAVPSMTRAKAFATSFTRAAHGQRHDIIDSRVSARTMRRVAADFLRLRSAASRLASEAGMFRPEGSQLDLWPLFRRGWRESTSGPNAIAYLFQMAILQERLAGAAPQTLGIYIQENQPWELALIHLWRKYGHGRLVGVAHSTVPFWDLRYLFDPSSLETGPDAVPIPDSVALNGPMAVNRFEELGYPNGRYCEVEALRYLYLLRIKRTPRAAAASGRRLKLLVLGDLLPVYTEAQLNLLERCAASYEFGFEVTFKPHPAAAPLEREISIPGLRISARHISEELAECDAVFVGSATSSAADAYHIGVSVVSMNDGTRINFSPLYGLPGVHFVSSPAELIAALKKVGLAESERHRDFFTIDEEMPRWKQLLAGD